MKVLITGGNKGIGLGFPAIIKLYVIGRNMQIFDKITKTVRIKTS